MTDDDLEVISVRLPMPREYVRSLDRLVKAGQFGSRTAYIHSLLTTSIEDELEDHAAEKAA